MPFHMFTAQTIESLRERSADSEKAYRRISGKGPAPDDLRISRGNVRQWNSASLTVECAITLPFFFLSVIMLISFMDAVGLPQTAADPVADHRVPQLCGHGIARPVFPQAVAAAVQHQIGADRALSLGIETPEIAVLF